MTVYWAKVVQSHVAEQDLRAVEELLRSKPTDKLHLAFVVLLSTDDEVYVASHAILRLCGALSELLDEIDSDGGAHPLLPGSTVPEIIEELPTFEVDAHSNALEGVLEYLVAWVENGRPTVLARPLCAPLEQLVSDWEWSFLKYRTAGPLPRKPSTAESLAAMVPFVREPSNSLLYHPQRGTLSPSSIAPLLQLMRAADFLAVDSLRDLCCAFLASKVMDRNESEVASMLDLDRPLTEEELEPLFKQHPFLRPRPICDAGTSVSVVSVGSPATVTPRDAAASTAAEHRH